MKQKVLITFAILLTIVLIVPFLIPIPPLKGTVPPEQLADPDSRFADVDGLQVHYKVSGQGEPTWVLLHGFASSLFSWREVMGPLGTSGTVIAYDRPASGLTERLLPGEWTGESPYSLEAQAKLTVALLDKLGIQKAILVGNSAGGTVAVLTALRYPERVQALVLVDASIYAGGGAPSWARPLFRLPQVRRLGPLVARSIALLGERLARMAWHDPSLITPQVWEGYSKPVRVRDWDKALWELTLASHPLGLDKQLHEIRVPTLVITGDDDRIVPTEQSVRLAREIPNAELMIIPQCGHIPHEEKPEAFLQAVNAFVSKLN